MSNISCKAIDVFNKFKFNKLKSVIMKKISMIELSKRAMGAVLISFFGRSCLEFLLFIDVWNYGKFTYFRLVFNLRAVFQDQHIVVHVIVVHIDAIDLIYSILNGKNKD